MDLFFDNILATALDTKHLLERIIKLTDLKLMKFAVPANRIKSQIKYLVGPV